MASHRSPNYDELAPTYDQRFASGEDRGVGLALNRLAESLHPANVLEAGCGTGHWLAGLAEAFPQVGAYGLDLSTGMLARARRHARLHLVRGRAEALPFASEQFDLIYSVNALHHFSDGRQFVSQARRLLRAGGALAVTGMDPRRQNNRWYIYDYFAGVHAVDLDRFPARSAVLEWMLEAGFQRVEWRPVEIIQASKTGREVLSDPFLEKNSCSQLAMLSEAAYQAGLEKVRSAVEAAEQTGETLVFENVIYLDMLVGWI